MKALRMDYAVDPATEITDKVGDLVAHCEVMGAHVLVALYTRPEKTKGGVFLTSRQRDEDIYQGKVGLVLKLGPLAFQPDEAHKWAGDGAQARVPVVGDWVVFRTSDGWPVIIGEQHCRMVEDVNFRMIVANPDVVY